MQNPQNICLEVSHVTKTYDKKVTVLKDIDLSVREGEFIVLLGPSGCGKSTLLRIVAGLENVTSGTLKIDGKVVNDVEPAKRDIAMVFQDYALYPHMTVQENLSFGLRIRKMPENEITESIQRASKMLNIDHLLDRKPAQLSGGQRQRVAIGRAIVRKPKIFLFDEPLSNLDAKLRVQTRIELAALHQKVGSTALYVTHDQAEAMTLANRIVVMNKGYAQHIGTPLEVYYRPANRFVASFVGSPTMNFFEGELQTNGSQKFFKFGTQTLNLSDAMVPRQSGKFVLGLRPESIKVLAKDGREAEGGSDLNIRVILIEPHGHETHLIGSVDNGEQVVIRSSNPKRLQVMESANKGQSLAATIDRKQLHWFELGEDGKRIYDLA